MRKFIGDDTQPKPFGEKLGDFLYDTVFHVGDTALQFTANLIRGPDNSRKQSYEYRHSKMQQRKGKEQSKPQQPMMNPRHPSADKERIKALEKEFQTSTQKQHGQRKGQSQ